MTNPQFQSWITALRSGNYKQCYGKIKDEYGATCAVGVANAACGDFSFFTDGPKYWGSWGKAIALNDVEKKTFPEIADILEQEYGKDM